MNKRLAATERATLFNTLWTSILESIGYVIVVALCIAGGFVAYSTRLHSGGLEKYLLTVLSRLSSSEVILAALGVLVYFLAYFFFRAVLLDRPMDRSDIALPLVFCAIAFIFLGSGIIAVFLLKEMGAAIGLVGATVGPPTLMFILTLFLERNKKRRLSEQAHRFVPKIFYPAFATCFLSFCLGWILFRPSNYDLVIFYGCSVVIAVLALATISWRARTPVLVALLFVATIFATYVISIRYKHEFGIGLLIALLWTFSLGFAEVAKRPSLLSHGQAIAAEGESVNYYVAGANWSSIVFLNLLLFMPLLILNNAIYLVFFLVVTSIILWHVLPDKTSNQAKWVALSIGYLLPLGLIALMIIDESIQFDAEKIESWNLSHQTDRLITLLGVFLTIVFVLYPEDFKDFARKIGHFQPYLSRRNCLLFAVFVIAVQGVFVTFMFSVMLAVEYSISAALQVRVDKVLIILIVELLFILLLLFLASDEPGSFGREPTRNATASRGRNKSAKKKMSDLIAHTASLTRPTTSSIAGLLSVAFALRAGRTDLLPIVQTFAAVTFLCMFGFVVNDIFDREKDLQAGRLDKPIALGQISTRRAASLATALALSSLLTGFSLSPTVFAITAIALALLLFYSTFSRQFPKLKGFYTGVLCCLPVLLGVDDNPLQINMGIFFTIIIFIFGREIVIDATDIVHDSQSDHATIALVVGKDAALLLGWIIMSAGIMVLTISQAMGMGTLLAIASLVSLVAFWIMYGRYNATKLVSFSRVTMLLVIGAMLLSK